MDLLGGDSPTGFRGGDAAPFPCPIIWAESPKQMKALDRLKAAASMKPQRKVVDLGNGEEFEYFATPTTLAERAKAQKQARSDDATDFAMQLLVSKAKDENGTPLFTVGDIPEMRNSLPASIVEALMLQLLAQDEPEEEDVDPKPSRPSSRKTES